MSLIQVAESFKDQSAFDGESPQARRSKLSQAVIKEAIAMAELLNHYKEGSRRAGREILEALSTSDLARYASGQVIDRIMLDNYAAMDTQWQKFCAPTTVNSFRPSYLSEKGVPKQTFKDVPEKTPFPMAKTGDVAENPIQVAKTGLLFGFSFEARVNDDLEQLVAITDSFPEIARETEDDRGLRLMVNLETGALNTAFFNVGNANIGSLKLTATNLQTVYVSLSTKRDANGTIIPTGGLQLVVGPALQFEAERILNTSTLEVTDANGVKTTQSNPLQGKFTLVVNEKQLGTSWIVMPKPSQAKSNPFWFAKLRGWEQPDFRYKADAGVAAGGGALSWADGGFDDDTIWYRGRHIIGVKAANAALTYGSDNTGA